MEQRARRAYMQLLYNGKDISEDISKDLISATWADKSSKESDDLSIKLHNTHGLWSGAWLPSKGTKIKATIITENWSGEEGIKKLPCGTFEIDEIIVSSSPSAQAEIKAVSVPITSNARGQSRTRAWESIKLSRLAQDIAGNAGLEFIFDTKCDPEYQREDQIQESDLGFLQGLCNDAGLALKVSHDKLIIFDEAEYAKNGAVLTLTPKDLTSWKIKSKSAGTYGKARVKYHDPETNEDIEAEIDGELAKLGEDDKNGRVLELNQRCKSAGEAEFLAKKSLCEANKKEVEISISMPGTISVVAGVNINMSGFGAFDGKYSVTCAAHTIGGGYISTAQLALAEKKKGKKSVNETDYLNWSEYTKDI